MIPGGHEDYTVIQLPHRNWFRFVELATRATKLHEKGGWQDRLRAWCGQMDEGRHTITLSHQGSGRRIDDMTFIARAIEQRNKGGWQKHAFDIFVDTHPRFTGIVVKPREIRR
jgi:hypothetical protein